MHYTFRNYAHTHRSNEATREKSLARTRADLGEARRKSCVPDGCLPLYMIARDDNRYRRMNNNRIEYNRCRGQLDSLDASPKTKSRAALCPRKYRARGFN